MKYLPSWHTSSKGFSLIEMLVVAGIIGILSSAIILNFSRSRFDINQSTSLTKATIRFAQAKSVASTLYNGFNPCGYGITRIDATRIAVYVGPNAATNNCATINKNYQAGRDIILTYQKFSDTRIEFKNNFSDIFFLPPDPKTYLNNDGTSSNTPLIITVGVAGTNCPTNCKNVYVYPSGKIESD